VVLSVGSRQMPLPQRLLGRDLFWWLTKTRLLRTTVESRLGQRMRHRDTLIGSRGSALLGWVKDDAEFIAERIAERAEALARDKEAVHV
jgi:hypothetical protein